MKYASFTKRFLAYLLDAVLMLIPTMLLGTIFDNFLVGILVSLFYIPVFMASEIGATPGKYFMKIKVVREDGSRITMKQSYIRYFLTFASSLGIFVGYLFYFFTGRKQTFHDMIAHTVVIETYHPETKLFDVWLAQVKNLFQN